MVLSLLIGFRASRRYDADRLASHGVNDNKKATARYAQKDETLFAIIFAVIESFNGERIFENGPRGLEPDAMLGVVGSGFLIIPLENAIFHNNTA
jgi:hypothetical protein